MMNINPLTAADFYKTGHIFQYPEGTQLVYSNFTPRSAKHSRMNPDTFDNKVVMFGLQGFIKWFLIDTWNIGFFSQPKEKVVARYKRRLDTALGPDSVNVDHIAALHDLGYLPIEIKAIEEGNRVNIGVPVFTIKNTVPEFFWVTNYLESVMSAELWKPITSATIAYEYRKIIDRWSAITGAPDWFSMWQGHDFSMRGLSGVHDAASSGAGHLLSFAGTDTISAIDYLEDYYDADATKELVGGSVPATEHSVMAMGTKEAEIETFRRLITEIYPEGIVSIVSDTWDFWQVITSFAKVLKPEILNRRVNGLGAAKVVFRPDSGDPVKIICGYTQDEVIDLQDKYIVKETGKHITEAEFKGAVECLWDIFGGDMTEKGYKSLNQRVGLIYGDSITLERAERILSRLAAKGFASSNIVFGIGSYTYQYNTRDTFGMAMKATYGVVQGEGREIFKDPKTDDGTKKSAKGLLRVEKKEDGDYVLFDQQTAEQEKMGELRTVFKNSQMVNEVTLSQIRKNLGTF